MWKRLLQTHCSDEFLVALLDGELAPGAERAARRHIQRCWDCRARMGELNERAEAIALAFSDEINLTGAGTARAKAEFLARRRKHERQTLFAPQIRHVPRSPVGRVGAAAVAVALVSGLAIWNAVRPRELRSDDVLAAARKSEQANLSERSAFQQKFRVDLTRVEPAFARRSGQLEVWSDPSRGRFASRWRDERGVLKHGLWQPAPGREYVFQAAVHREAVPRRASRVDALPLSTLARLGVDLDPLEAGFMNWLESRAWRPIALAEDFGVFAAEDGVIARAERVHGQGRQPFFRISAQRTDGRRLVEMTMDVDEATLRPRAHKIRVTEAGQCVELALAVENAPADAVDLISATVFEPYSPALPAPAIEIARAPAAQPSPSAPIGPGRAEMLEAEMNAWYVLHRMHACLGEPVSVIRDENSVLVKGIAETEGRKLELQTALTGLGEFAFVRIDIRSLEEALRDQQGAQDAALESGREPAAYSSVRLPFQERLEEYLRRQGGGRNAIEFSNEAMSASSGALDHAWALRRLAERFSSDDFDALPLHSRGLLDLMVRDHLDAVRKATQQMYSLLEPPLSAILPYRISAPSTEQPAGGWSHSTLQVFQQVRMAQALVHALFGGRNLPADVKQPPDEAVLDLLPIVAALGRDIEHLKAEAEERFAKR